MSVERLRRKDEAGGEQRLVAVNGGYI